MLHKDSTASLLARALGFATAWLVLGLGNVVAVGIDLPEAASFWSIRFVHHLVDVGRHIAAGLSCFAVVLSWGRWIESQPRLSSRQARAIALSGLFVFSLVLTLLLVLDDLAGMARRSSESSSLPLGLVHGLLAAGIAASIPLAALLGPLFRRRWLRIAPLPVVALLQWVNVATSTRDNHGLHLYVSWFAAMLLGFALVWPRPWADALLRRPRATTAGIALFALPALCGIGLPLNNSQRVDLLLWDANLLPNVVRAKKMRTANKSAPRSHPFFEARTHLTPITPRQHNLLPEDGVVIVLSVDALRADVITKKNAKYLKHISRLAREGTSFLEARSPGSATVYTLSAVSTGLYFSQRYWTRRQGDHWPYEDEATHFPGLLQSAGVHTLHARSTSWLEGERRLMSGFASEKFPQGSWKWARGKDLASSLIQLLEERRAGPVFAFAHFLDTHHPYWPGRKKAKATFRRYLHAIDYVDQHIGRILDALSDLGLEDRAVVVVTADHGEAFGEHGSHGHATTLYEEQVRVPLIFWGPSIPKQQRHESVTLADLGPTMLELFGQPVPAQFMGESLVPLLDGRELRFRRPVIAEARYWQSLVSDDGIKVIRNRKTETVEIYDLERDPEEKSNLSDADDPKLDAQVARLIQFFEVHTLRRDGYQPPLRK